MSFEARLIPPHGTVVVWDNVAGAYTVAAGKTLHIISAWANAVVGANGTAGDTDLKIATGFDGEDGDGVVGGAVRLIHMATSGTGAGEVYSVSNSVVVGDARVKAGGTVTFAAGGSQTNGAGGFIGYLTTP